MPRFLAFVMALTIFAGCARVPADGAQAGAVRDSPGYVNEREAEMGQQIHQAILSSFRIYSEPRLVRYVKSVGRSLARQARRQDLIYRFTVLYDPRVYATEAPGGFIYLTTGFLNFLQNEAELAALLANEIALLQFQDPRFSRSHRVLGVVAQTGAIVAPFFGSIGVLAATGLVLLNAFRESRIEPPTERFGEADEIALHSMVRAGHDPQAYLDLFGRVMNPDPAWAAYLYDYVASHPVTMDRMQGMAAEFEKLPLVDKSFDVNRNHFLEMTKGVREIYQKQG